MSTVGFDARPSCACTLCGWPRPALLRSVYGDLGSHGVGRPPTGYTTAAPAGGRGPPCPPASSRQGRAKVPGDLGSDSRMGKRDSPWGHQNEDVQTPSLAPVTTSPPHPKEPCQCGRATFPEDVRRTSWSSGWALHDLRGPRAGGRQKPASEEDGLPWRGSERHSNAGQEDGPGARSHGVLEPLEARKDKNRDPTQSRREE